MKKEIWAADAETDPFKNGRIPRPFVWGAKNNTEYHEFKTTDQFIAFIRKKHAMCYAHNGGKFDWLFTVKWLSPFSEITVINGRLSKFGIGNCEFRDSYNIIPERLATYSKETVDYAIFEPEQRNKRKNAKIISAYLKSDCVNLYELISQFHHDYGTNITVASTAMKEWRKISGEVTPRSSASFYHEFAPFYYGGRTQCFKGGITRKPFKIVDLNSAYPDAMTHLHPYGTNYTVSDKLPTTDAYLSRCFIVLDCISHGALPFRDKKKGTLSFPDDNQKRRFKISGWEYIAAVETNSIDDVTIIQCTSFSDSIEFTSYVNHFYNMKVEAKISGDTARYIFSKRLLNSLYGKLGSCPENYEEFIVIDPSYIKSAKKDGYGYCTQLGPWVVCSRPLPPEKQQFYNVATAASITGYVRANLWRAIHQCSDVYYCDTDSIFCEDTNDLALDSTKLGAWDIEAECNYGAFAGKKLYAVKTTDGQWKTAHKGAKLTPKQIISITLGKSIKYIPDAPSMSLKNPPNWKNPEKSFVSRNIRRTA